jgi:hypothetical protein
MEKRAGGLSWKERPVRVFRKELVMNVSNYGRESVPQLEAACPTCDKTTDLAGVPCAACVALEITTGMTWHTCAGCAGWVLSRNGAWCRTPGCNGSPLYRWRP